MHQEEKWKLGVGLAFHHPSRFVIEISSVLAIVTFLAGLERVGPINAATLSTIEPVVTVVLAALILHESITPVRVLGGMMILIAVIILTRSELPAQDSTSAT